MKRLTRVLLCAIWALVIVSCGDDDDESPPVTQSPTISNAPTIEATVTPSVEPTASPTHVSSVALATALNGAGEVPPSVPVTRPHLVLAYKEGRHVRVMLRHLLTGQEKPLFEYDESHEANHSHNTWEEALPSVALSSSGDYLVYASASELTKYTLSDGTAVTLLTRVDRVDSDTDRWVTAAGAELCCAYSLVSPSISPAGQVVALMSQYEGKTLGAVTGEGSDPCVAGAGWTGIGQRAAWNDVGDLVTAAYGDYSSPGLYVNAARDFCHPSAITQNNGRGYLGSAWSPDRRWIAAGAPALIGEGTPLPLVLLNSDGSSERTLVPDGRNVSPLFAPDGAKIYYLRIEPSESYSPAEAITGLWSYDVSTGFAQEVAALAKGWFAHPRGWTTEGYLVLDVNSGCSHYDSCSNRVALLNVVDGSLVYLSGERDFTTYAGFLP